MEADFIHVYIIELVPKKDIFLKQIESKYLLTWHKL